MNFFIQVGGFYKHFGWREGLVSEAIRAAAGGSVECGNLERPPVTDKSLIDDYLSETHRDDPATGCRAGQRQLRRQVVHRHAHQGRADVSLSEGRRMKMSLRGRGFGQSD